MITKVLQLNYTNTKLKLAILKQKKSDALAKVHDEFNKDIRQLKKELNDRYTHLYPAAHKLLDLENKGVVHYLGIRFEKTFSSVVGVMDTFSLDKLDRLLRQKRILKEAGEIDVPVDVSLDKADVLHWSKMIDKQHIKKLIKHAALTENDLLDIGIRYTKTNGIFISSKLRDNVKDLEGGYDRTTNLK